MWVQEQDVLCGGGLAGRVCLQLHVSGRTDHALCIDVRLIHWRHSPWCHIKCSLCQLWIHHPLCNIGFNSLSVDLQKQYFVFDLAAHSSTQCVKFSLFLTTALPKIWQCIFTLPLTLKLANNKITVYFYRSCDLPHPLCEVILVIYNFNIVTYWYVWTWYVVFKSVLPLET